MARASTLVVSQCVPPTLSDRVCMLLYSEVAWYATSFVLHMLLACALMLISVGVRRQISGPPPFDLRASRPEPARPETRLDRFDLTSPPLEPAQLVLEPTPTAVAAIAAPAEPADAVVGSTIGGNESSGRSSLPLGSFEGSTIRGIGPGPIRVGPTKGIPGVEQRPTDSPFGVRSGGSKTGAGGGSGNTIIAERTVAAALAWLARHQNRDGSWSFTHFDRQCKGAACGGVGANPGDAAATAVALLPFLGAGQTHLSHGPYKAHVYNALYWMLKHQGRDGSLHAGARDTMYAHGLGAIALSEAYGLSNDRILRQPAQAAINFIVSAQHPSTGGWRYQPGDEGDTSVFGWQLMALKSAQMAALDVPSSAFAGAKHFLDLVAVGDHRGQFSYLPGQGTGSAAMTAVGLLCRQYLGMSRDDPAMQEGISYLMRQLPDVHSRPLYYWYYATQVMHNCLGPDWDRWNRAMRRVLIETQIKEGCAHGSWDPDRPQSAAHLSEQGGRVLVTALSALILEVYYRYLPLYKTHSY